MPEFKTVEIGGTACKVRYPVKRLVANTDYVFEISGELLKGYFSHQPKLEDSLKPRQKFVYRLYAGGKRLAELASLGELPSNVVVVGQVVKQ